MNFHPYRQAEAEGRTELQGKLVDRIKGQGCRKINTVEKYETIKGRQGIRK